MADNSSDVIVTEDEFLKAADQCKQYCEKLQAVVNAYQEIMTSMVTYECDSKWIRTSMQRDE